MVFAGADGEFARKPLLHASSCAHSPNPQELNKPLIQWHA